MMSGKQIYSAFDEQRIQLKTLKKQLKAWEHQFLNENGRKPDKQDIAGFEDMAKKYKYYAKLKVAMDKVDAQRIAEENQITKTVSAADMVQFASNASIPTLDQAAQNVNEKPRLDTSQYHRDSIRSATSNAFQELSSSRQTMDQSNPDIAARSPVKASVLDKSYLVSKTMSGENTETSQSQSPLSSFAAQSLFDSKLSSYADSNVLSMTAAPTPIPITNRPKTKKTVAAGAMKTADLGQNINKFSNWTQRQQAVEQPSVVTDVQNTMSFKPKDDILDMFSKDPGHAILGTRIDDDPRPKHADTAGMTDLQVQDFISRRCQIIANKELPAASTLPRGRAVALPQLPQESISTESSVQLKSELQSPKILLQTQTAKVICVESTAFADPKLLESPAVTPLTPRAAFSAISDPSKPPLQPFSKSDIPSPDDSKYPLDSLASQVVNLQLLPPTRPGWSEIERPIETSPLSIFNSKSDQIESPLQNSSNTTSSACVDSLKDLSAESDDKLHAIQPISPTLINGSSNSMNAQSLSPISPVVNMQKMPSLTVENYFLRLPKEGVLRCRLTRKKNLLDKANPTYLLYNELEDKFMLSGKKKLISKSVHYIISDSSEDISKDSPHYLAKLKGNFKRNSFIMTDTRSAIKQRELTCVNYSKNVLPRELQVVIPAPIIDESAESGFSTDIMVDVKSKNTNKLLFLKNKPPRWNEQTQSHCLNFGGRVTQPSIKNMQLIAENDENHIVLQFGRCGPDLFTLDVRWPMTPIEAFSIALTTFEAYDST
ncbi:hypothetical protein BDV3_002451 [Batrachochytrium dendrobatidis]